MLPFSLVTLLALLAASVSSGAAVTSHSSTEHPLESTTRTSSTGHVITSTKSSVTEELESTHVLGIHDDEDDDDEDDSGENDAPLPTLPPTDLVPPERDAEIFDWSPQTQRPPVGLLVVRIIQIIRPTERPEKLINANNQNFMAPKENIYTPNYSSVMPNEDNYSPDEQAVQKMHLMQLLRARLDSMQHPLFASNPFQTPWYRSFSPSFAPSRFNTFNDFDSNA